MHLPRGFPNLLDVLYEVETVPEKRASTGPVRVLVSTATRRTQERIDRSGEADHPRVPSYRRDLSRICERSTSSEPTIAARINLTTSTRTVINLVFRA